MTDTTSKTQDEPKTENEAQKITFADLALDPQILKVIEEIGYTHPTPIQAKAIPHALEGKDVLGLAQTGTGKTASFTLPMIHRLAKGRAKARMPRSLVLAPTRELADQVAQSFESYAKYHKLDWALLIGGVSFADQEAKLMRGVDVLIATPGRLLDHFERGKLLLTGVQILVVDEADRMLDMGFIPDIERIFKLTPFTRQTLFFSATMPPAIKRLTEQFLNSAVTVEAERPSSTATTITAKVLEIPRKDDKAKREALRALIKLDEVKNAIVFCNRKSDVDIVAKSLTVHGFDAAPIHGDLTQKLRMDTLEKFRNGDLQYLVASDVAARGLDIPEVSHVFNYDVPFNSEDYVHRIGRTGRAGRKGTAYMISTPLDDKNLGDIEKLIKADIERLDLEIDYPPVPEKSGRGGRNAKSGGKDSGRGGARRGRPSEDKAERAPEDQPSEAKNNADKKAKLPYKRDAKSDSAAKGEAVVGFGDADIPSFLR